MKVVFIGLRSALGRGYRDAMRLTKSKTRLWKHKEPIRGEREDNINNKTFY